MKNSRILSLFSLTLLLSVPAAYAMEKPQQQEQTIEAQIAQLTKEIEDTAALSLKYKNRIRSKKTKEETKETYKERRRELTAKIAQLSREKTNLERFLQQDSGPQAQAPELSTEETTETVEVKAPAPVVKKEESTEDAQETRKEVVIKSARGRRIITRPARLFTAKMLKAQRKQLTDTYNKNYREAPQTTSQASDYGIVEFNHLNNPSVVQCKTSKAQQQMYNKATNPLSEYSRNAGFWGTYSESSLIEDFQKALKARSTDNLNLSRIKEDTDRSLKQIGAVLPSQLEELESDVIEPTTQDTHRIVDHYTQIIDNTFARLTNAATILNLYQQLKDQGLIKFEICSETLQNVENSNEALCQLIEERDRLQNNMNVRLKAESKALENLIARAK